MVDVSRITRSERNRAQLRDFGIPVIIALVFLAFSLTEISQVGAHSTLSVIAVVLLGAGIALIPLSPWVTVVAVACAMTFMALAMTSFVGIGALLLPVTITYLIVQRCTWPALVISAILAVMLSVPSALSGVAKVVVVTNFLFWVVLLGIAIGVGYLIRFLLDRERRAVEQKRELIDALSAQLSRDLHDSVGGVLTRVSLLAQQARASDAAKTGENLDRIVAETHAASSEVRLLLSRLRDVDALAKTGQKDDPVDAARQPASTTGAEAEVGESASVTDASGAEGTRKSSAGSSPRGRVVAHGPLTIRQLLKSYTDRLRVYGFAVESSIDPRALATLDEHYGLISRLLDESVLNTIKYAATSCPVHADVSCIGPTARIQLSNTEAPDGSPNPADSSGIGLAALAADVEAIGGRLTTTRISPPLGEDAAAEPSRWQLSIELSAQPAEHPTAHRATPSGRARSTSPRIQTEALH